MWAGPGYETTGLGPLELALYSEGLLEYRDPQASIPVLSIGYGFTDDELKALCKQPSAYVKVRPRLRVDKIQTHKGLKGGYACCLLFLW